MLLVLAGALASAQQNPTYTVTDLGVLPGTDNSVPVAINSLGQIAAQASSYDYSQRFAALFKPEAIDLGLGNWSWPVAINDSGQVLSSSGQIWSCHVYTPGQGTVEILPPAGYSQGCVSSDIDASGRVLAALFSIGGGQHVGLYSPSTGWSILPDPLGYPYPTPSAINTSGQITGNTFIFDTSGSGIIQKAFVYTPGQGSVDIGNLPSGGQIFPTEINNAGKVVGYSYVNSIPHAWLFTPGEPLDDLGLRVGLIGWIARSINNHDQIVGNGYTSEGKYHGFLYSGGVFRDLNDLIPSDSGLAVIAAAGINDAGQISGMCGPPDATISYRYGHVCLLTPITPYKAVVQPPINVDGSSTFKATRGSIPLKFTLLKDETVTCDLPSATIAVTRIAGGTNGSVDESTYSTPADKGSNFRIDSATCQYVYNLAATSVGVGTYRVDIFINGNVVGNAVFGLQ